VVEEENTCSEVLPTCADGVDNDEDGYVDLADGECSDWTDSEEGAEARFKTAAPSIGENNLFNFILKGDSVSLRTVALSR
jgi:hypothetical protein